jgi:hypothetical protein
VGKMLYQDFSAYKCGQVSNSIYVDRETRSRTGLPASEKRPDQPPPFQENSEGVTGIGAHP